MTTLVAGTYDAPPAPREVRAVYRLLLVVAGLSAAVAVGSLLTVPAGSTGAALGAALWALTPGAAALVLAQRLRTGRPVLGGVRALAVVLALLALARLGLGDVRGLSNLVLPVGLLVLSRHDRVRESLRGATSQDLSSRAWGARPASARRLGLFRRGPVGEGGQIAVEAIGALAVVAIVVTVATAAVVNSSAAEDSQAVACSVMEDSGCGASGSPGGGSADDGDAAPGAGGLNGTPGFVSGVLGFVVDVAKGAFGGLWSDVVGLFEVVTNPSLLWDALQAIWNDPSGALLALVWDADTQAMWDEGRYGELTGRLLYNVGTLFLAVGKIGKAGSVADLGTLERIGVDAADLARLEDLANAGQRAADAARAGNLDEAADIAAESRRHADELQRRADAAGCLSAGTAPVQVLAIGGTTGTGVVVVAGGDVCGVAGDAARQADEAADAAAVASSGGRPRPATVDGPGGESLPGVSAHAVARPVETGKGLQYDVPAGTQGVHPNVTGVRIMDPVTSGPYPYPNGYVVYMNRTGQAVHPLTGRTLSRSDPYWHIPLDPP